MIAADLAFRPTAKSLNDLLAKNAREAGGSTSYRFKKDGSWKDITWAQELERVRALSDGLSKLGVQPGDRVCLIGSTRPEWTTAHLAVLGCGAATVAIYHSNLPHECSYIARDSGAAWAIVENELQWKKFAEVRAELPAIKKVVVIDPSPATRSDWTVGWDEVLAGGAEGPSGYDQRVARIEPSDLCTLIYTSGTTGDPKGVILSHGNWCYVGEAVGTINVFAKGDTMLLFLPLAHSFAQDVVAAWLGQCIPMVYAESLDRLLDNAAETHPTAMPAVPRVFEKAFAGVVQKGSATPGLGGMIFRWAMRQYEGYAAAREAGRSPPLTFGLARALLVGKLAPVLKERFGGKMRLFVSGGAPLAPKIAYFFDLLGIKICEGYGLTETAGAIFVNRPEAIRIGTVGTLLPGSEVRIADDGEILLRGPGVMKGYWNKPEATAEVLTPEGWFASGDVGVIDPDGYLRITDRKKEIIVTAGGKKVPPQNLENALKTEPIISQALVHGDKRKFISALVTINVESAKQMLSDNLALTDVAMLAKHPSIRAAVQAAIDRLNARLPSYEQIKKFAILDKDFTLEGGELTPSLKVKRKVVTARYQALLDSLYADEG